MCGTNRSGPIRNILYCKLSMCVSTFANGCRAVFATGSYIKWVANIILTRSNISPFLATESCLSWGRCLYIKAMMFKWSYRTLSTEHPNNYAKYWLFAVFQTLWQFSCTHYNDVIMSAIASQITSLKIVYSIVYSDADQRKYQSSALLAFVRGIHRWPVNFPHKWPVTRKCFHLMTSSWILRQAHGLCGSGELWLWSCLTSFWFATSWCCPCYKAAYIDNNAWLPRCLWSAFENLGKWNHSNSSIHSN